MLSNNQYYQNHPTHILGEPYETSGRFGKVTKYRGSVSEALERIVEGTPSYQVHDMMAPGISSKHSPLSAQFGLTPIQADNLKKAAKIEAKRQAQPQIDENGLISFDEVDSMYNPGISEEEKMVFVWYMRYVLKRSMNGGWEKYHTGLNFSKQQENWLKNGTLCTKDGQQFEPAFIFVSGHIGNKLKDIEKNRAKIVEKFGEEIYTKQVQVLEQKVIDMEAKRLRLDDPEPDKRLRLLVTSAIAQEYMIAGLEGQEDGFRTHISKRKADKGEIDWSAIQKGKGNWYAKDVPQMTLQNAFALWLYHTKEVKPKFGLTSIDVVEMEIERRQQRRNEDPVIFRRQQRYAKKEATRLFSYFLAHKVRREDRIAIEKAFLYKYGMEAPIDYSKVPIGFSMAKVYNGMDMDIRTEKREAVAAAMITGSLVLAYGVGFGKTWSCIFVMAQFIENGWAKRPLLAVPLQVYPQFIREIKGILPQYPVNELANLSKDYLALVQDETGKAMLLPENSITVVTYNGLKNIGLSEDASKDFIEEIDDILAQNDANPNARSKAAGKAKSEGLAGRAIRGTAINLDDMGIDFLAVDEAHAAKKVFTTVASTAERKGTKRRYAITSGTPSAMAIKTFMLSQYIQFKSNIGNTLLLTATPFTNSPLEVYSMLALVGLKDLERRGLKNLKDFFDSFVEVSYEQVVTTTLSVEFKEIFVGYANLSVLQGLLRKFFLYKQSLANLKRPNKIVLPQMGKVIDGLPVSEEEELGANSILPMTAAQKKIMSAVVSYVEGGRGAVEFIPSEIDNDAALGEDSEEEEEPQGEIIIRKTEKEPQSVRVLKGVNFARMLALSPYLFPYKGQIGVEMPPINAQNYVETSPKLQYIMDCIKSVKEWHEGTKTPISGQIIYMNTAVKYFPLLKQYLVEQVGFKEHEVGIIQGSMPALEGKAEIQDKFLGRKYNSQSGNYEAIPDEYRCKVLIGSSSITEGINLQTHNTVIYNAFLPWNPTDTVQLEGRGWRQGNLYANIRIVYPLLEDSMDVFMFQKLEEKTRRINQIWDFDGNVSTINLEEFDPKELKYLLIKDAERIAEVEAEDKKVELEEQANIFQVEFALLNEVYEKIAVIENDATYLDDYTVLINRIESSYSIPLDVKKRLLEIWKALSERLALVDEDNQLERLKSIGSSFKKLVAYAAEKNVSLSSKWRLERLSANLKEIQIPYEKILAPRQLGIDKELIRNEIARIKNEYEALNKSIKELTKKERLAARALEIDKERQADKRVSNSSVDKRVQEFAKLNYLLKEKRAYATLDWFAPDGKQGVKRGSKVRVQIDAETRRIAKILNRYPRSSKGAMYLVEYNGGYKDFAFEHDIITGKKEKSIKLVNQEDPLTGVFEAQLKRIQKLIYSYE